MASHATNHPVVTEGSKVPRPKQLLQANNTSSFPQTAAEFDKEGVLGSARKTSCSQSTPDKPKVEDLEGLARRKSKTLPSCQSRLQQYRCALLRVGSERTPPSTSVSREAGDNDQAKQGQTLSHSGAGPLNSQSQLVNAKSLPPMKLAEDVNPARERPPLSVPLTAVRPLWDACAYTSYKGNSSERPVAEKMELIEEGGPIPLSVVAKHLSAKLPQLFRAKSDYTGPPAVREGEMLLVQYKKTIKVVHGITTGGHSITLTHNCKLLLTHLETEESRTLTAKALLSLSSLPLAMVVMKPFKYSKSQTVIKSGTILLNASAKTEYQSGNVFFAAEDTTGQIVNITASCPGVFSIHPQDIQLHLVQLMHHCKLPATVYLEGSFEAVTLHRIDQQQVLVAQPLSKSNSNAETAERYDFPADCNLQVVRVVSRANKRKASEIQYYSMFRQLEGDDDSVLYESLKESTAIQWRNVPPARPHPDVMLANMQLSGYTLSATGTSASFDTTVKKDRIQTNLTYLRSLRVDEILELLEAMQLEEYMESFRREKIDGEVLSSLTEEDLLRELNVQKRLHRIRLMKVIEGIYSVQANFHELYI